MYYIVPLAGCEVNIQNSENTSYNMLLCQNEVNTSLQLCYDFLLPNQHKLLTFHVFQQTHPTEYANVIQLLQFTDVRTKTLHLQTV